MCAQNAVPPPAAFAMPSDPMPLTSWSRNQIPRKKMAGISTRSKKITTKIAVSTRDCGYRTKYAPMTAAMAPLAPSMGTLENGLKRIWMTPAAAPAPR